VRCKGWHDGTVKPQSERPRRAGQPIPGKKLLVGLLGALIVALGLVFYVGMTGGSTHVPGSKPSVGFVTDPAASTGATPATSGTPPDAAIGKTISDRAVRDALRQRVLAAWAADGDPEVAQAARQGRFLPAPPSDGGDGLGPEYLSEVLQDQYLPMARTCYEELLSRKDAGGRLKTTFTIVADEKLGGIIDDVSATGEGGIEDERFVTCVRESMYTLAIRPPAHGGTATVHISDDFPTDHSEHDGDR
jgi:hypothetical protein